MTLQATKPAEWRHEPKIVGDVFLTSWKDARRIGASDVPTILGLNSYKTPHRLWLEKRGEFPQSEDNEAMKWGRRMENVIAFAFAEETGLQVTDNVHIYAHPTHNYLTCTPDRFVSVDGQIGPLEIKNVSEWFLDSWKDGASDPAMIQLHAQMTVLGARFGYLAACVGGNKLKWVRLEYEPAISDEIVRASGEFWKLLETGTPPPLSAGDLETMKERYPRSNGETIDLPDSLEYAIRDYENAAAQEKHFSGLKAEAQARICNALGGAERGRCGRYVVSWANVERKSYTVAASSGRRFSLKQLKETNNAN